MGDFSAVCKLAYLSEKILHGTPSGVDHSVSTYGGIIKFVPGQQVTKLKDVPKLRILLVNTNVSRNTKAVVQKVRDQFIAMPRVVKALFDAIDNISLTCLGVLEEMSALGDSRERYQRLEQLVDYNQKLLEALNVSHDSLADICETVAEQGSYQFNRKKCSLNFSLKNGLRFHFDSSQTYLNDVVCNANF